jgi:hypothetical protein
MKRFVFPETGSKIVVSLDGKLQEVEVLFITGCFAAKAEDGSVVGGPLLIGPTERKIGVHFIPETPDEYHWVDASFWAGDKEQRLKEKQLELKRNFFQMKELIRQESLFFDDVKLAEQRRS